MSEQEYLRELMALRVKIKVLEKTNKRLAKQLVVLKAKVKE